MSKPLSKRTLRRACERIIEAQIRSHAKLMIAYRLYFEPGTIAAIERVRSGELGEVHFFSSTFCQMVDPANHRARNGIFCGPLFDMGPYPIDGVRNLFADEPLEVFATSVTHPDSGFGDLDDTVSVILRFPNQKLANRTPASSTESRWNTTSPSERRKIIRALSTQIISEASSNTSLNAFWTEQIPNLTPLKD